MTKNKRENYTSDYKEFINNSSAFPARELDSLVLNKIRQELHFSPAIILLKLGIIHALVTLTMLYICPQFGVRVGNSPISLMNTFMKWGHLTCIALCGIALIGGTFFLAAALLKRQESFWLRKQMPLIPISLSLLTLLILVFMGASIQHVEFILWSVFGIAGGLATFEIGRLGKFFLIRVINRYADHRV